MTKMNTHNILYAIDNDLNSLCHEGIKGMRWRQHDPSRRWQRQAVYANGQSNPDAKERIKSAVSKAANKVADAAVSIPARHVAKRDARLIAALRSGSNGPLNKGSRAIGRKIIYSGVGGTISGAVVGHKLTGSKIAGVGGAILGLNVGILGSALHLLKSRDIDKYSDRFNRLHKRYYDKYFDRYMQPIN